MNHQNSFEALSNTTETSDNSKPALAKRNKRKQQQEQQQRPLSNSDSEQPTAASTKDALELHDRDLFSSPIPLLRQADTTSLGRSRSFDDACADAIHHHLGHLATAMSPKASAGEHSLEALDLDLPKSPVYARDDSHSSRPGSAASSHHHAITTLRTPIPARSPGFNLNNLRDVRTISNIDIASPESPLVHSHASTHIAQTSGGPRREVPQWAAHVPEPPSMQPLGAYVAAELLPGPSYATTDAVWGQTERDRVYNSLIGVPFQLERLIWYGMLLCLDSFLAMFTLLPVRVCLAIWSLIKKSDTSTTSTEKQSATPVSEHGGGGVTSPHAPNLSHRLRGDQLFDVLCATMFSVVVAFLWNLRAGSIYFWVKDLTQEFLKISVLQTALELSDKICCSFGIDLLVALAASCTHVAGAGRGSWHALYNLVTDACMSTALVVAHGAALMSQAIVFSVAMNSRKNTLIALLIASNFTEIKGTVFKRFDPTRIYMLACQDIVELFHLLLVLVFVAVEEAAGAGRLTPSRRILTQCGYVFAAEVAIDIVKHAVLVKFNEIRPGVYREFLRDLCDKVTTSQSHSVHRLVGFEPFAPCALFIRLAATFFVLVQNLDEGGSKTRRTWMLAVGYVLMWAALVLVKVMLGFIIKATAVSYVRRYDAGRARRTAGMRVTISGHPTVPYSGNKKDE